MLKFRYRLKFSHTGLRHIRPIVEVANKEEIRSAAVFNILHSSLCQDGDKSSFGHHLFKVYNQFSDSLTRETVFKMQNLLRKLTLAMRYT